MKKIIPNFIFQIYHWKLALLGALLYRFPSRKLKVIGVTGTNGKSTVVYLISRILDKAGYSTAAISSVQFKIGEKVWPNGLKMTMPGRLKIQKFIRQAVDAGCQYLVLETTSEGIKQYRHKFINYQTAVFTNLTPEHIESHGGFGNYREAKAELFKAVGPKGKIIVNTDDKNADYFLQFRAKEKIGYGLRPNDTVSQSLQAQNIQLSRQGINFTVNNVEFKTNLLGEFNVYNILAALAVGLSEDISLDKMKSALETIQGVPGRLEMVIREPFTVIVDYAHTPDALEKVYQAVKKVFSGRLIGLIGSAGGGRDRWKRPEMGKIADKYCDEIIITNEDPYDEDPEEIIEEVAKGIWNKTERKVVDRRQAIRQALQLAREGDIVVITGKGCESWICAADGEKIPWDDREVVKEEFEKSRR